MKQLDLSEFKFSDYEMIVVCALASSLRVFPRRLSREDWSSFEGFLPLPQKVLMKMLDLIDVEGDFDYNSLKTSGAKIDPDDFLYSYELFDCIIRYYEINIKLEKIHYEASSESLESNIKLFYEIVDQISNMNTNSGAFECLQNGNITKTLAPQTFTTFQPFIYIDYLSQVADIDYLDNELRDLEIIYRILKYELRVHSNSMYLIIILQIMKHAKYASDSIQSIGAGLYDNFHCLLQDARLLSIQTNYLFQDLNKPYEQRTKHADNTTRLHLLYGFDNYDSYSLRLDLSHEGIGWIHYNQISPGGVKCNFLSESEYEDVIGHYPALKKCFINYGDRWFLKEKKNCSLNLEELQLFERVEMQYGHRSVFQETYSEENVVSFLSVISNFMLPIISSNVDKSGDHAKYVFNLDKLMLLLELYWYSKLQNESVAVKAIETQIIEKGINYGIIESSEEELFSSEAGILMIIDSAFERCFPGRKLI